MTCSKHIITWVRCCATVVRRICRAIHHYAVDLVLGELTAWELVAHSSMNSSQALVTQSAIVLQQA